MNLNDKQFGKHRYTGATKAVPVVGSKLIGSPSIGAAEVHPARKGPVRKYYKGKHAGD